MKKTVLTFITVVMLFVMMLSTSVNAATISVDPATMEIGDIVTVTISTDEEVESMEFDLKFDATKYKFVENSLKTDLASAIYNVVGDTVKVSAFDVTKTTKTLTLQFEAIANGENVAFEISGIEFSNDETIAEPTVNVTVEEKEAEVKPGTSDQKPINPEEPTEPSEPTDPNEPTDPTEPSDPTEPTEPTNPSEPTDPTEPSEPTDDGEKYYDEDGNEITSLPQAGSVLPAIILGIAILGIAIFAGYKIVRK